MNKRIKELEQQARFAVQDENGKAPYDKWRDKFAELIIGECAYIATMNQHQYEPVGLYVLKHFGVE